MEPTFQDAYKLINELCSALIAENAALVVKGNMSDEEAMRQASLAGKALGAIAFHAAKEAL